MRKEDKSVRCLDCDGWPIDNGAVFVTGTNQRSCGLGRVRRECERDGQAIHSEHR